MEEKFRHLLPLLIFTALLVISIGLVIAVSIELFLSETISLWSADLLFWSFVLAVIGILVSFTHLGKGGRSYRVFLGLGHSWLSREAVFSGLFIIFTGSLLQALWYKLDTGIPMWLGAAAAIAGLLTLWSIGRLYNLPPQLAWRGWAQNLTPVSSAVWLAVSIIVLWSGRYDFRLFFFIILIFEVILLMVRYFDFANARKNKHALLYRRLNKSVSIIYRFRYFITVLFVPVFYLWCPFLIPHLLITNIVFDRYCLYASTAQQTPKAEVAEIKEERMRAASRDR